MLKKKKNELKQRRLFTSSSLSTETCVKTVMLFLANGLSFCAIYQTRDQKFSTTALVRYFVLLFSFAFYNVLSPIEAFTKK